MLELVCGAASLQVGLAPGQGRKLFRLSHKRFYWIEDEAEKIEALRAISDHIIPGRWAQVRPPNAAELKMTTVVAIPIDEASAKVRSGPPVDDEGDYGLAVWAGVLPLQLMPQAPQADDRLLEGVSIPEYVRHYQRPRG